MNNRAPRQGFAVLWRGLILLVIALCLLDVAAPQQNPRVRMNFNADWRFARQARGVGALGSFERDNADAANAEPRFLEAMRIDYDDSQWERVDLPHTWNAHDVTDEAPGYWRGVGWYRKHFQVDARFRGRRLFLEFEGANSVAEAWLNGARLGKHPGGYTGFEFEITASVRFGRENLLAVKVDNLYRAVLPPTVKTDYTFYGGIYRDVWLRIVSPTYVTQVTWLTPQVSDASTQLRLRTQISRAGTALTGLRLAHQIVGPDGTIVKSVDAPVGPSGTADSTTTIERPLLWSPEAPNLYKVRSCLFSDADTLDCSEIPLGFRWYKFDPQRGFFLNGRRVQIQGTNWHQSYPGMGDALPNSRHELDMQLIRDMGANFWRTSHYPHDPATLDASDRLGLMVWEELPVNKEIGNPDAYLVNVTRMAQEMIGRDRNHPSIIVWGIAGEINAPLAVSRRVVDAVARQYRALDPTRPVAMHAPRSEEIESLVNVVGSDAGAETDLKHQQHPTRSYMTAEYSVATIGRGVYEGRDSEEAGCTAHEEYLRKLYARPWMAGGLIWHQFDYDGETYDTVVPHVVAFGMADVWRIPKDVYYFYQSQWSTKPMVHIVGHWTWTSEEGRPRTVNVYSNAPTVELFLNGTSLGLQHASGEAGLPHPPYRWRLAYAPGELRAVARVGTQSIADERRTAGAPYAIALTPDTVSLRSGDPESLAYIRASVVDAKGTTVPTASNVISFTLAGPGDLLPQTWLGHPTGLTWNVVNGESVIALRANRHSGHATVSAYSPGLRMGRVQVNIAAPGKRDEMEYREPSENDEP